MHPDTERLVNETLNATDNECENENCHNMVGLARSLYNSLESMIPEQHKHEAALSIHEAIIRSVFGNL